MSSAAGYEPSCAAAALLGFTIRTKLADKGPKIVYFRFVLDPGKDHLGARDFGAWIFDIFLESRFVPRDSGILVGIAVVVVGRGTRLAASSGPTLFLASGPISWQGMHFLKDVSPAATSCALLAPIGTASAKTASVMPAIVDRLIVSAPPSVTAVPAYGRDVAVPGALPPDRMAVRRTAVNVRNRPSLYRRG
jgi:hypothetical protein